MRFTRYTLILLLLILPQVVMADDENMDGIDDNRGQLLAEKFCPGYILEALSTMNSIELEPEPVEILSRGAEPGSEPRFLDMI